MSAALAIPKSINVEKLFKEIAEYDGRLVVNDAQRERDVVGLANRTFLVQKYQLFRLRINPATKKKYATFTEWISNEVHSSRASNFRFLGVKKYLSEVPNETLEEIGKSRCFELAKVGREKPSLLPRFLKEIEKHPEIPVVSLHNMVANSLAGGTFDSGRYEEISFVVKAEDLAYVKKALAVMQAMEAVENPDTAAGRGVHLVSLSQEFLSGKEESKILKQLEAAGAFNGKSAFKVEGD
jgi:hypothetical protein